MKPKISILVVLALGLSVMSCAVRPIQYSTENAHSHNDYEQKQAFTAASSAAFGSIEADIFLVNDHILVAHSQKELDPARTLVSMYLDPLTTQIKDNQGFPYKDHHKDLQLLIDLKDDNATTEYVKAVELLNTFPEIVTNKQLIITFTGNIPVDSIMETAPAFVHFDGIPFHDYSIAAEKRVYMFSDNFKTYSNWDGLSEIAQLDYDKLKAVVTMAHHKSKKVRFWNAPDNPKAWALMQKLGVDYINTDHIDELARYLNAESATNK